MPRHEYDLELFRQLNAEYAGRPLVPKPRVMSSSSLEHQATRRAIGLDARLQLRGKRVLEIGAGRGHLAAHLASEYGCEVVGVDIVEYETWAELNERPGVTLLVHDVTAADNSSLGEFDRILSLAVFEHINRPVEGLRAISEMLAPTGTAYVSANLYRGPKASHRYREVYFPFPHLLFDDQVFAEFYDRHPRRNHRGPAWVNKLTAAHYRDLAPQLGMSLREVWYDRTPLDEEFYARFSDVLEKYPREDLETDFIHMILQPANPRIEHATDAELRAEVERLRTDNDRLRHRLAAVYDLRWNRLGSALRNARTREGLKRLPGALVSAARRS